VAWRRRFAERARAVGWERMGEVATVAKVTTLRRWHQWLKNGKFLGKQVR
jgi:hypothetical protein